MNLSLPADLEAWVEAEARSTTYPDTSAYLADLIRREQERHQALAEIQELVTAGIESGISDLTMEQVRDRAHKSALERQRAHAG